MWWVTVFLFLDVCFELIRARKVNVPYQLELLLDQHPLLLTQHSFIAFFSLYPSFNLTPIHSQILHSTPDAGACLDLYNNVF